MFSQDEAIDNSIVDLTWFYYLGGEMADKSTPSNNTTSSMSSHDKTIDNSIVDLTWFYYLGGEMADKSAPQALATPASSAYSIRSVNSGSNMSYGNELAQLPSFRRGDSSQYLSSMVDDWDDETATLRSSKSTSSVYSHKTDSIRTKEKSSVRMSRRASLFEGVKEEDIQEINNSVVDLTWFRWLGGLMAGDVDKRATMQGGDISDSQSVDSSWFISRYGEEEEASATDNRFVDLTWFRYLGGLMANEGRNSINSSATTYSHRLSSISNSATRSQHISSSNRSSRRRPMSSNVSANSSRHSTYESVSEAPRYPQASSTNSEPSENPHAVDLTWFLWLGGMIQAPPQFNSERPESFDDTKAPWDDEIAEVVSPKRNFMMSIRKVLKPSVRIIQEDNPEAAHSPSATSSGTSPMPSLSEGRTVTPEQVKEASAGRLMGIFKRARERVFQVTSNRASAISVMRKENIATEDLMLVVHFAAWFSKLGVALVRPDHFCEDLEDGVVLLTLLEQIPGAKIGKFYKSPKDFARFGEFRKRENIQKFAKVGRSVGLRGDSFTYADLHQRNLHKVIPTLIELAGIVFHQGFDLAAYMPKELRETSSQVSLGPLPVS